MTNSGCLSEAVFAAEATRRGWLVYTTNVGHDEPADAIILKPPQRPVTVQVKTATVYTDRDNAYGVMTCRGRGTSKTAYVPGDFDILAAWLPDVEKFVFWRFDEIAERKKISYSPRRHRQPDNWDLLESTSASIITVQSVCS